MTLGGLAWCDIT